jgi:hypothetical protein
MPIALPENLRFLNFVDPLVASHAMIVLHKFGITSARLTSDRQIRILESDYDRAETILSALELELVRPE